MYKNNNQSIVAKWKEDFQTAELSLSNIHETGGYSSHRMCSFTEQEVKVFCVYSKNSIKIFEVDCRTENRGLAIYEINCEESLTWWQRVIRFVSFGRLYSNKSKLLAQIYLAKQIYAEDQLIWWQKVVNFISGGYFYRTTAKIDGKEFKYLGSYSVYDVEPALLTYTQMVDQEKSNFTGTTFKEDWILYKHLPSIEENSVKKEALENQQNDSVFSALFSEISLKTVSGLSSPFF